LFSVRKRFTSGLKVKVQGKFPKNRGDAEADKLSRRDQFPFSRLLAFRPAGGQDMMVMAEDCLRRKRER
jgi:hypothetical protein